MSLLLPCAVTSGVLLVGSLCVSSSHQFCTNSRNVPTKLVAEEEGFSPFISKGGLFVCLFF